MWPTHANGLWPLLPACLWSVPVGIGLVFLGVCAILTKKLPLSCDELLTFYPVSASFQAMAASTADTINAAPPLYFFTAWCWGTVFNATPLSLRLLSAVVVGLAMGLMFQTLRRAFGGLAAAAALLATMATRELMVQGFEARFHGMFFAETALAILLYQRLLEQSRPSPPLLVMNAATHAALMMTNYTAPFFSGAILAGMLGTRLIRRRMPLQACLSVVCGWMVFLPWIPVFLRHRDMGKPGNWLEYPLLSTLWEHYLALLGGMFEMLVWGVVGMGVVGALGCLQAGDFRLQRRPSLKGRALPMILLVPLIGAIPLVFYLISSPQTETSLLLPRYTLPCLLAIQITIACLVRWISRCCVPLGKKSIGRAVLLSQVLILVAVFLRIGAWVVSQAIRETENIFPVTTAPFVAQEDCIVVGDIHDFVRWHYYAENSSQLVFLADWPAALREGGGGPLNYRITTALKRCFPEEFSAAVRDSEAFFASRSRFWVRSRTPEWTATLLADKPGTYVVQEMSDGFTEVRRTD